MEEEELTLEEIQQYLLDEFNRAIYKVRINYTVWEKKDNISFKQFMLENKETIKEEMEELIAEGCTEEMVMEFNHETFYHFYTIEELLELVSLENTQYIKQIEYIMKCGALSYLDVCCRDRTYTLDDIVMD